MVSSTTYSAEDILQFLDEIVDPEIPVVTIREMGMLLDVHCEEDGVEVIITPSYTACPAMSMIKQDIISLLHSKGIPEVTVTTLYSPTWSTDWLSDATKAKLQAYGIAPPVASSCMNPEQPQQVEVECPRCHSTHTKLVSQFGSTPCKSLYTCTDCKEPFDYFKCH